MSDLDLRELSAPIEALRPDVKTAYQHLDARWEKIGAELERLPIPCLVSYTFSECVYAPERYKQIEWRKWRGKRRFCITSYDLGQEAAGDFSACESVKPYDEWSAEQRLEMLDHVPALFENAPKQISQFIAKAMSEEVKQ